MPEGVAGRTPCYVRLGVDVLNVALEGALGSDEDRIVIELADALGVAMCQGERRYIERRPTVLAPLALPDEDRPLFFGEVLD